MELNQQQTVGSIVAEDYRTAGVFKSFGIDFCCGGKKTLEDACARKGVEPIEVIKQLDEIQSTPSGGGAPRFKTWSTSFLIDYIVNQHHAYTREKLPEIGAYLDRVAKVHGNQHPELKVIREQFMKLRTELLEHLKFEEDELFPLINSVEKGKSEVTDEVRELLQTMIDDHDGAGEILAKIRELSNDYTPPVDACATYRISYQSLEDLEEDIKKHVHLENNILAPRVKRMLELG